MNKLLALRQKRHDLNAEEKALRAEAGAILEAATSGDGTLTDAQTARKAELNAELNAITSRAATLDEAIANAEVLADLDRTAPAAQTSSVQVREAVQDDPRRGFRDFADFALAVQDAGPNPAALRNDPRIMAAAGSPTMQQGITADGGVLVPPAFSNEVWDGMRMMSDSLLSYCDVMPIDPGVQSVTTPAINETSRADGSRWGGVQGYWKSELTQMTGTKPVFREVKLEPQEVYVFAYVSDKLLRHAPGAASALIARAAADELNFKIGNAIWDGDGVGKPAGFTGCAAVISIAKETGQAAATIVRENIRKMYARMPAAWRAGASWFISQDAEAYLEEMALDIGTGGVPVYLPSGGIADAPLGRIKGLPVRPVEYASALGTVDDIVFANLNAYRVGIRAGIESAISMHLKFDYAQTAYRFITEIDGQSMLHSAITPFNGGPTQSPFITLATRA